MGLSRFLLSLVFALLAGAPRAAVLVREVPAPAVVAPPVGGLAAAPALSAALAAPLDAPAAAAPRPSPWEDARAAAALLAGGRGVPAEGRALLRENLARYLLNGYSDESLAALARRASLSPAELPEGGRWRRKIARDLAEPYDDAAALARLDHLEAELADCARFLTALAPEGNYSLSVVGSLLRGRLSAHSDVDLMLETDDPELLRRVLASPFGYLVKARAAVVGPAPKDPRLKYIGPVLELGDGRAVLARPGVLREAYARARAADGAAEPARELSLELADLVAELDRLGRELDEARDDETRRRLAARIDALARGLPEPPTR